MVKSPDDPEGGSVVPDFRKMAEKAKQFAGKHPDKVDEGLDKAENLAEEKTGGRFDSQIQQGEQKAEDFLGAGGQDQNQDQDGGQDRNQ